MSLATFLALPSCSATSSWLGLWLPALLVRCEQVLWDVSGSLFGLALRRLHSVPLRLVSGGVPSSLPWRSLRLAPCFGSYFYRQLSAHIRPCGLARSVCHWSNAMTRMVSTDLVNAFSQQVGFVGATPLSLSFEIGSCSCSRPLSSSCM